MVFRVSLLLLVILCSPAYAADELDVTTLPCDVLNRPSPREMEMIKTIVIPWLEGYFHRTISLAGMQTDLQGLRGYCQFKPDATVLSGAQLLMGPR